MFKGVVSMAQKAKVFEFVRGDSDSPGGSLQTGQSQNTTANHSSGEHDCTLET